MFSHLVGMAVQLIIGAAVLIFLYQVFLSDLIRDKSQKGKELQLKLENTDKIARVKLTSDDPRDIEKFITDNAQYLSDQMVGKLVSRIESIKDDRVINADNMLKKNIEALAPKEEKPLAQRTIGKRA